MKKPLFLLRNMRPLKEANSRDLDVLDKEENIEKATKSLEINDNQECKFDVNSFKAVFLTDTGSYIYRTKSLLKARQIQKQVFERCKFGKFHKDWLKKNCSKEQMSKVDDWLKGKCYEENKEEVKTKIEEEEKLIINEDNNDKNEELKINKEEENKLLNEDNNEIINTTTSINKQQQQQDKQQTDKEKDKNELEIKKETLST